MQRSLVNVVRGLFSPGVSVPAKDAAAFEKSPTAILSQAAWMGREARHQVRVLDRTGDNLTIWSPEYVDIGEAVWLQDSDRSTQCNVTGYIAAGGGYRLTLSTTGKSRRAKERTPCNTPGDLEWVDGLTRVRCPVRVTNLTTDGAQIMLSRPAPEIRSVRLRFNGRTELGSVRYCIQIGASYLAGVEFL